MSYSRDRDLLAIEPRVFVDVPVAGQDKLRVTDGAVVGTVLTSASADFEAAQVEAGGVVLVEGVAHEVLERVDAHTLAVSLARGDEGVQALAGVQGSGLEVICRTFEPQAEATTRALERLYGLEAWGDWEGVVAVDEEALRRLEALGTLRLIYREATAPVGDSAGVLAKAQYYEREFERACRETRVRLDADGDGEVDRVLSVGEPRMARS